MPETVSHLETTSRRDFLKQTGAWSLAALASFSLPRFMSAAPASRPLPEDQIARGIVFLDGNKSGNPRGQKGLAGVLVSNGVDVVATDSRGRYQLPVKEGDIVYVIKPRNYMTALDSHNLPRFYYIHSPNGTPDSDFIYKGVEPTGPLPSSIDFPLYDNPESDSFEVLFIADPQAYDMQYIEWYAQETIPEFQSLNVDFGIALGDIVGDHLDLYKPYNQVNSLAGFPWYNVLGNHDMNYMAPDDKHSDATFTRTFGPSTYAFQRGPVHFIILNNVFWEGFNGFRKDGWPNRGPYKGRIRNWQLRFLRNYLKHVPTDNRIVICSHIPMLNRSDEDGSHATPQFRKLMEILSSHPHTMSFSGHTHINMNFLLGKESGYNPPGGNVHHHFNLTSVGGSWYRGPMDERGIPYGTSRDGTPKGYAVVRFDGGSDYHIRFKAIGKSESHQMNITLPTVIARPEIPETVVHVNVFNATTQTRVRVRIDGNEWQDLKQEMTIDPVFEALRVRTEKHPEAAHGNLGSPLKTDHHWRGPLPANLATGWHNMEIVVKNMFGEVWREHRTFAVVEKHDDLEPYNRGTRRPRNENA